MFTAPDTSTLVSGALCQVNECFVSTGGEGELDASARIIQDPVVSTSLRSMTAMSHDVAAEHGAILTIAIANNSFGSITKGKEKESSTLSGPSAA